MFRTAEVATTNMHLPETVEALWIEARDQKEKCGNDRSDQVRSGLHAKGGPVLGRRRKMQEYVHNCYLHAAKIDKRI